MKQKYLNFLDICKCDNWYKFSNENLRYLISLYDCQNTEHQKSMQIVIKRMKIYHENKIFNNNLGDVKKYLEAYRDYYSLLSTLTPPAAAPRARGAHESGHFVPILFANNINMQKNTGENTGENTGDH